MRGRSQGIVAILLLGLLVVGAGAADRLGKAEPAPPPADAPRSSIWICPHGGGVDWTGFLSFGNPGPTDVQVRLSAIGDRGPVRSDSFSVPAGRSVVQEIDASGRNSATYVEVFGGWVGAGWLIRAEDPDHGTGTEPCVATAGREWHTADATTEQGEDAYLIVTNPFASAAVFDVALFSPDRPPLRDTSWSDVELAPGTSVSMKVDTKLLGEPAVSATVDVKAGRVAVASLGVSEDGGVRSVIGAQSLSHVWYLPVAAGSGSVMLNVGVPGEDEIRFSAGLLSQEIEQAAGGLEAVSQAAQSARGYPIVTAGASSVVVEVQEQRDAVVALRAQGPSGDDAATGGAVAPGPAWVVPTTVVDRPSFPGIVLVNAGTQPVQATVRLLPPGEGAGPEREIVVVDVPAGVAVGVPARFLAGSPQSSALVTADGDLIALGASTSGGIRGPAQYGLTLGLPVPAWVLTGD